MLGAWNICLGQEAGTCETQDVLDPSHITPRDLILQETSPVEEISDINGDVQEFGGPILGYVTPWNARGYEVALKYKSRLTHVSPVWYQVVHGPPASLRGGHHVDLEWMNKLRMDGHKAPKIIPRFLFEGWSGTDFVQLLQSAITDGQLVNAMVETFVQECDQKHLDGVLLEVWTQWWAWGLTSNPMAYKGILIFLQKLSEGLEGSGKLLALAVPPAIPIRPEYPKFTSEDFQSLKGLIGLFSVMTYDASNNHSPGPNAPIGWIAECLEELRSKEDDHGKILVGLNFYGYNYGRPGEGKPILGHEYLSLLNTHEDSELRWDEIAAEHVFLYPADGVWHRVYYPSRYTLSLRVQLARSQGTGLAIWELGQGLDSFMSLL